jgi:hypothetical protein
VIVHQCHGVEEEGVNIIQEEAMVEGLRWERDENIEGLDFEITDDEKSNMRMRNRSDHVSLNTGTRCQQAC